MKIKIVFKYSKDSTHYYNINITLFPCGLNRALVTL